MMDSSRFNLLVKNFTNLTRDEYAEVSTLSKLYPYSQVLHLIHSRAAKDLQYNEQTALLHQSAVYSTDRGVVKWVMTTPRQGRVKAPAALAVPQSPPDVQIVLQVQATPEVQILTEGQAMPVKEVGQLIQPVISPEPEVVTLSGDALRKDLLHELKRLQKLKHDFEASVEEFQKSNAQEFETKPKPKEGATIPLLEEIKSTRKKLKVESPRQKEQNEIIDHFIKAQPTIPKANPLEPSTDLSEESSALNDTVVSETLVSILLKQGKKDKAIEVLRKLIWKFPQKKSYFAAQIEDLKN